MDIQPMTAVCNQLAKFVRHPKEIRGPMVLTVNGLASVMVQDAKANPRGGVRQGLEACGQGMVHPTNDVFNEIRAAYDL